MRDALRPALAAFEPDPDGLLSWLCDRLSEEDLNAIAAADYGEDQAQHLQALRAIRDTVAVPQSLGWYPGEVCALTRWSGPDEASPATTARHADDPDRIAQARRRAFAAAVLLRASVGGDRGGEFESATAAVLIESTLILGLVAVRHAGRMLAAVAGSEAIDVRERPLIALGVVICNLAVGSEGRAPEIGALMRAIDEQDRLFREDEGSRGGDWLLDLPGFNAKHGVWRSLARHYLFKPERPHPPEVDELLRAAGAILAG